MVKPEIINETPITMAELKDEIAAIKKRDEELNFRSNKTEEYLNQFQKIDSKKSKELVDAIKKLSISRLKDEHIIKIADLMPLSAGDVKIILQGYTVTINNENLKKIIGVVDKHR